ncbi:MAG: NAD(P)H-dependent oxidoreductase [Promicromonosporaceae bacterium]|nr:NAD(P)H-dependent oxidoreductase [Promicromonosporaceae bacterium]
MSDLKIAVIVGSTRPGRHGRDVADWVLAQATGRESATYEIVDLADHPLPLLDELLPAAMGQYEHEHTKAWSATIAKYDGFVFVTPEYNHSIPAVLKNAIDYLAIEWQNKAAAFAGYGFLGASRAVEHLRNMLSQLQVAHVSANLALSMIYDFEAMTTFAPGDHNIEAAATMFDQLEAWATALKPLRD